jgi:hypothetical protein
MSEAAPHHIAQDMMRLVMGGETHGEQDIIDLYESGFYSDPNVDLRGHTKDVMMKFHYAQVITDLW